MADEFKQKVAKNIEGILNKADVYEGPLGTLFAKYKKDITSNLDSLQEAKTRDGLPVLSAADYTAEVNRQLSKKREAVKSALLASSDGDNKSVDIEGITGLAGAAGSVSSALGQGSILGLIGAIPQLLSNSIIGDYIKAAFSMFLGNPKPASFSEALDKIKLDRGVSALAKDIGIDGDELKSAMMSVVTPAGASTAVRQPLVNKPEIPPAAKEAVSSTIRAADGQIKPAPHAEGAPPAAPPHRQHHNAPPAASRTH